MSRARASPLYPTVTSRRKSYLDNWISGTRLPTLHSAHWQLSSTCRESSEQWEGRLSVCPTSTRARSTNAELRCHQVCPLRWLQEGDLEAHGPKAPECCEGAGLLPVTVSLILDEARVPCQQGLQPGLCSANVDVSETPNLGTDTGKSGPTGKRNSGQVIYLGRN